MAMKKLVWMFLLTLFLVFPLGAHADFSNEVKVLASDGAASDSFGLPVDVSGDIAIAGANGKDDNGLNSGAAYILERDSVTGDWSEKVKLLASDGAQGDSFGSFVSISGDTALVGAGLTDDNGTDSGSAYVFVRNPGDGTWSEQAKLLPTDGKAGDKIGLAVSLSGDLAAVGGRLADSSNGAVYIFVRDASTGSWTQEAKFWESNSAFLQQFGDAVAVQGDTLVVGSSGDADKGQYAGAAYVYVENSVTGNWELQQKLLASDGVASDRFGSSVSISGDFIAIGADEDDGSATNTGAVYLYEWNSGTANWDQKQKLVAPDAAGSDFFGFSVSLEGNNLVVGSHYDDDDYTGSGSVYVFERNSSTGVWEQIQKLLASDRSTNARFGQSVSLSGDNLVVGAMTDELGINANNGSVYAYSSASACAGLVENCDFEIEVPSNGTGGGWTSYDIGPYDSDGWVSTNCKEGSCFDLNGFSNQMPTIEQTVPGLTVGATYELTGDYAIYAFNWSCSYGQLAIDINGENLVKLDPPGCTNTQITWGSFSTNFVAPTSDVTIAFRAQIDGDRDYAIDNIALVEIQGPDITVTPTTYDFGSLTVGTSSDQEITVTNDGSADLTLGDVAVADPIELPFEILGASSCLADEVLSPTESCSYTVRFSPDFIGTADSTFDITSDDLDEGSITITLAGEGVAAAAPDISISPTNYDFGTVTVGASDTQDITVTNDGDALLTLGDTGVANQIEAPFEILAGSSCLLDAELAPTESCVYTVSFSPVSVETFSADFDIVSDDPDEASQVISLSGEGVADPAPNIDISPASIDFPDTTVGVVLEAETVTISNTGTADLNISASELVGLDAAQFNLDALSGVSPCGGSITLAPAEKCSVDLRFAPDGAGAATASLNIISDDPDNPNLSVVLTGNALDPSANNPPSKPRLIAPANGQTFSLGTWGSTRIFRWHPATDPDGDEVSYDVYLCTDSDPLASCYYGSVASYSPIGAEKTSYASFVPLDPASQTRNIFKLAAFALFGLLTVTIAWRTRKPITIWILLIVTGLFISSCGDSKGGIKYSVDGLQSGTTYYWAVVAKDGNGGETASDVWSFTTK